MGKPTEGERQAADQWEEYNRDNYKRWPWTSFLIVAVFSGIILLVSASPANMFKMAVHQKALSAVFIIISILLLIPSIIGIIFHGVYVLCKSLDKPFPCQAFRDRMTGVPGKKEKELVSESSATTASMSVWTAESQTPRSGYAERPQPAGYYPGPPQPAGYYAGPPQPAGNYPGPHQPAGYYPPGPPPTYDSDWRARERAAAYDRGYDPYSRPRAGREEVHRAVIEHDRQRPAAADDYNRRVRAPSLAEQARMQSDRSRYSGGDPSNQESQGKGKLWRDSEGQLVLHI